MTIRKRGAYEYGWRDPRRMTPEELREDWNSEEQQEAHREAAYRKALGEHPDPRDPEYPDTGEHDDAGDRD